MKIAYIIISSMFALFLIFVIHGYITFDLNIQELKNSVAIRNEAQANNVIQDLDKFIDKRIGDFRELSKLKEIQDAITDSNQQFIQEGNAEGFIEKTESDINTHNLNQPTPFIKEILNTALSRDLRDAISFYKEEYGYDVVQELFVTNKYGANIALGAGTSDYRQDDEDWWKISRDQGSYVGKLELDQDYERYSIPFGFRITDGEGNFLGVMRVSITIDDLLHEFINDAEVIQATKSKNVSLLDDNGRIIYSIGIKFSPTSEPVAYYDKLIGDAGFFELKEGDETNVISYSESIGYKDFQGFGWTVLIIQDQLTVINEFVNLRNSILLVSVLGMVGSIAIGIVVSFMIGNPLRALSKMAKKMSQGDFDVRTKKSRIKEIGIIDDSFNNMAISLKKLVETEKELAEAKARVRNERLIAIGQVAASMAHNMKNPLATIRSSAEIVKKNSKSDNKELVEVISRMDRAIDTISHQIEDVLNFVRITPLDVTTASMHSILQSAVKSIEIPKNIELELPKDNFQVNGDVRKLEIVFINLILNAIQAIGQNNGKIIIRMTEQENDLIIEIQDTGPGIPDELLNKIFNPLITTKQKGTGLGLSTCRNIIEQHGGVVNVKNNPTTFTVRIPKNYYQFNTNLV